MHHLSVDCKILTFASSGWRKVLHGFVLVILTKFRRTSKLSVIENSHILLIGAAVFLITTILFVHIKGLGSAAFCDMLGQVLKIVRGAGIKLSS